MKRKGRSGQQPETKRIEDNGGGPLANENIRAPRIQLIDHMGTNHGVVGRFDALNMAREAGLDLVMIADQGAEGVPVTKIMDYGKELYNRKKKMHEAKKHQKVIQIKEIKIRPKIGEHDYLTKLNQGIGFLEGGKKVKITLQFRGREMATKNERGTELFDKIRHTFEERGLLERIIEDKDVKGGNTWSKVFSLKSK